MRLFIAGQKAFGAAVFDMAIERGHEVLGVSSPEHGSGTYTDGSPKLDRLRRVATLKSIPWMPAGTLRAENLPPGTDLILAAHSHDYIGMRTLRASRLGAVGYHPSLLPRHRGRDAVKWAVKMGDPVTGGTVYWLDRRTDGGPVAAQDWCFIKPGETAAELWRRALFPMGVRLMAEVLDELATGVIRAVPQDEAFATWEPSLDSQPLFKPELPQIGPPPEGFRVETRSLRHGT
ncbi:MAG: formyltransferase family protein [Sumerlaeia bacterium]